MKLLLAVDGSAHSDAAANSLLGRNWPAGTAIEVVAVLEPGTPPAGPSLDDVVESVAARLRAGLGEVDVSTRVVPGNAAEALLTATESRAVDLLVLGAYGRNAIARFLLGSVSLKLLLHAPCSVEIVKGQARLAGQPLNLLVPLDFSARSRAALERVRELPWPAGSRVRLLAAIPPELPPEGAEVSAVSALRDIEASRAAREHAESACMAYRDELRAAFAEAAVSIEVKEGDPRRVILESAGEWPASLIIMGSHGRTGISRLLLGSVAQAVALHAPCSVQVVR